MAGRRRKLTKKEKQETAKRRVMRKLTEKNKTSRERKNIFGNPIVTNGRY